MFVIIVGTAVM